MKKSKEFGNRKKHKEREEELGGGKQSKQRRVFVKKIWKLRL